MATALVVDKDPHSRQILTSRLRRAGFTVITHTTAEEALANATQQPTLDVAILDVRLSGPMDGLQLCVELRHTFSTLPVIFVSTLWTPDDIVHGREVTATDNAETVYLTKPIMFSVLFAKLQHIMRIPALQ